MIVLQSKFSKLATKKFSRYHRNILKIRFLSLNILKQHITSSQHQQKQTNKWKKRLSKAILLWWFCRKPQNSHRKFVAKQCATVGILQLLQLTHNKKIFFSSCMGRFLSCFFLLVFMSWTAAWQTLVLLLVLVTETKLQEQEAASHAEKEGIWCFCENEVI